MKLRKCVLCPRVDIFENGSWEKKKRRKVKKGPPKPPAYIPLSS
jgi:hypothetical protein